MTSKGPKNTKPPSTWKATGGANKGRADGALGPTQDLSKMDDTLVGLKKGDGSKPKVKTEKEKAAETEAYINNLAQ